MKTLAYIIAKLIIFYRWLFNKPLPPPEPLAYSPLMSYPRNELCYCESGKKFKKCCWISEISVIPLDVARKMHPLVKEARKKRK